MKVPYVYCQVGKNMEDALDDDLSENSLIKSKKKNIKCLRHELKICVSREDRNIISGYILDPHIRYL